MADESVATQPAGGGKGLMVILIALVVILLVAVIGGGYYLVTSGVLSGGQNESQSSKQVEKQSAGDSKVLYPAEIKDLVLNITNSKGREKLMKLSFTIKSTEEMIEGIIEENKAEIIDVVIGQISARSSEELLTVGGKALLKEELLNEINSVINEATQSNEDIKKDNIKKLFFTSFVIK